jgi:hypothetical protein
MLLILIVGGPLERLAKKVFGIQRESEVAEKLKDKAG